VVPHIDTVNPLSKSPAALEIMGRARRHFYNLPPSEKAENTKDVSRNFRLDAPRTTFDFSPNDQVAGPHRDLLLGLVRQIEALGGGAPAREPLILMWMMKHYDKEAAVQWKIAFDAAEANATSGSRIEYVIKSLSKAYVNPIASAPIREALDNFQWAPQASVQVIQATFGALQNAFDSAVEDTRFDEGLDRVDPKSQKEWMLFLMNICPRYVQALYVDHKSEFVDPSTMFAFVIKRETLDKPMGLTRPLCALSSRDDADVMQALLQEDPDLHDRVYLSDGWPGLLVLARTPLECFRCKGTHYKWQCPAKPSLEEQKGERDHRKWGLVPMCVLDPSKNRSFAALTSRDAGRNDRATIETIAALSDD